MQNCYVPFVSDTHIDAALDQYNWVLLSDGVRGMDVEADSNGNLRFRVDLEYRGPYDSATRAGIELQLRTALRVLTGIDNPSGEAIEVVDENGDKILVPLSVSPRPSFFLKIYYWIRQRLNSILQLGRTLTNRFFVAQQVVAGNQPIIGGQAVGSSPVPDFCTPPGTVATSLVYDTHFRLLTNNHVLAQNFCKRIGKPICIDGKVTDVTLSGFFEIRSYNQTEFNNLRLYPGTLQYNLVDLAWCDVTTQQALQARKLDKNGMVTQQISGFRKPRRCEEVSFWGEGSKTQWTCKILSTTYRYRSQAAPYQFWKNIIRLDTCNSQKGDSGAAIVAADTDENGEVKYEVVGLIRSRSEIPVPGCKQAFACPLSEPEEINQERIVTCP
ncbi:MAG: hypothetical protein WBD20_19005 [Pirellulaceae bacterium]